jgi:hypothetical protein
LRETEHDASFRCATELSSRPIRDAVEVAHVVGDLAAALFAARNASLQQLLAHAA